MHPSWKNVRRRGAAPGSGIPWGAAARHAVALRQARHERGHAGAPERGLLAGGERPRGRQALRLIDLREGLDGPGAAGGPVGRPWGQRRRPRLAPRAAGAGAQPAELLLRGPRERVAVGLAVGQEVPGEDHQLAGGGDHGHVPIFLPRQAAEAGPEGAGVLVEVLGGLHQQPAGVPPAGLGDGP